MRKSYSTQLRLDSPPIDQVELNFGCRDSIVPVLRSLQHVYSKPDVTEKIMKLIGQDINGDSSAKLGREGMDYWHILVLASVRLGCNYTYDQVQDLSENHAKLRAIMGIGSWDEHTEFTWQTIRDNVCRLKPETIDQISRLIVAEGQMREAIVTRDRSHRRKKGTELCRPTEGAVPRTSAKSLDDYAACPRVVRHAVAAERDHRRHLWPQHAAGIHRPHGACHQHGHTPHHRRRDRPEQRQIVQRV